MYYEENKEFDAQPAQPSMNPEMDYDTIPIPPKNRQNRLPLIVCGILTLLLLIEIGFFWVRVSAIRAENTRYLPDAPVTMEQQNQAFAFGPESRQVTIQQVEEIGWQKGIAKGYKLVRMNCQLGYQEDYLRKWESEVYLQVDGVYYSNIDRYELEQLDPDLMVHTLEPYNMVAHGTEQGWLYFVVPDGAKEGTVWLNALERDDDYVVVYVEATGVPVLFEKGENGNV